MTLPMDRVIVDLASDSSNRPPLAWPHRKEPAAAETTSTTDRDSEGERDEWRATLSRSEGERHSWGWSLNGVA